jgi:hypothetical protein
LLPSKLGKRLEKIRGTHQDLWADEDKLRVKKHEHDDDGSDDEVDNPAAAADTDDDDDDDAGFQPFIRSKTSKVTPMTTNKTYIVLSDSDDDNHRKISSRRQPKTEKASKKTSHHHGHMIDEREPTATSTCVTCLICTIASTLTSYNCCSKHLDLLVNKKSSHASVHTNDQQWPPQQVMILPMTDELLQRYLDPEKIHQLKTQTVNSPKKRKPIERVKSASVMICLLECNRVCFRVELYRKSQVKHRISAISNATILKKRKHRPSRVSTDASYLPLFAT